MKSKVHSSVTDHASLEALPSVNSSQLKNYFGDTLLLAGKNGVAITRHKRIEYVLLPATTYLELQQSRQGVLDTLGRKFDDMVATMNTPKAKQGVRKFFKATSTELGRTASKAAQHA
jgi:antitoxin Phd